MAEDSAGKITRRALIVGGAAMAAVAVAEATGAFRFNPEAKEIASRILLTTEDQIRTSIQIPEGQNADMPNTIPWGEIEEIGGLLYEGQSSVPLDLVPLVYGQNPDGPGQARWAKVEVKTKSLIGSSQRGYVPVDSILYKTAPQISIVEKIENGIVKTKDGNRYNQNQLGRASNPTASK